MSVDLFEAVRLMVIGMGVVFASLIALYLVMVLIARTLGREVGPAEGAVPPGRKPAPAPAPAPGAATSAPAPAATSTPGAGTAGGPGAAPAPEAGANSEEIAAVISGAVYTTLGPHARVRSISRSGAGGSPGPSVWAFAGRQEAMMPETAYRQRSATVRPTYSRREDARG